MAFTLRPQDFAGHAEGIAAMLHRLATSLDGAPGSCLAGPPTQPGIRAGTTAAPRVGSCADAIGNATPGARLLAWAVLYHDVLAGPGGICRARRVDAVDIDGRVYQITRLRGEAVAVVVLDDQPDPDDTPATQPGLTALLAAARRLGHHHHRTHDDANKGAQTMTAEPHTDPTGAAEPTDQATAPGENELQRLRRLIREQLAGAVGEDRLDIDLANGMLTVFGLPELPRRWTVRIGLTFVCEVTAGTDHEAFDTAEDAIAAAVTDAGCPIDVDWDSREQVYATPGDIDLHALDTALDNNALDAGPEPA